MAQEFLVNTNHIVSTALGVYYIDSFCTIKTWDAKNGIYKNDNINKAIICDDKVPVTFSFGIFPGPTGNCQLSVGYDFKSYVVALDRAYHNSPGKSLDHIKVMFKDLYAQSRCRRILLLDLNKSVNLMFVKMVPADYIISNTPYVSTNGSEMNIILFNVFKLTQ